MSDLAPASGPRAPEASRASRTHWRPGDAALLTRYPSDGITPAMEQHWFETNRRRWDERVPIH